MELINIHIKDSEYQEILRQAVAVIENARSKTAVAVVSNLNEMHWEIGQLLFDRKLEKGYGGAVVKHLSVDLKQKFPNMGMSERNLWDMKRYFERFHNSNQKLRHAVAVLPWWNINKLISKYKEDDEAILYYAENIIAKNWNREIFTNAMKLEMHLHQPKVNVSNNFSLTVPKEQSGYANTVFKDTYNLGFLGITKPVLELELENKIVEKIKQFLLELGTGFTFIGNQHVLSYNDKDYKVDLLFFHRKLRSLIAIDLKISSFKPEYIGKMNFYLSLLDRQEKDPDENPSIGIILCANKDNGEVELALDGFNKPIGVAQYELLIPQRELKQLINNEIKSFTNRLPDEC